MDARRIDPTPSSFYLSKMSMCLKRCLCAAVVVGLAAAGLTLAQSTVPITLHVTATVTPSKAGTKAHPQGVHIKVKGTIDMPEAYDPPLVDTIDVWFPNAGVYNGAKFPSCSQSTLARHGPRACPKLSIMGSGGGKATADRVFTYPKVTIVNDGAKKVFFYVVLNNPARVETPVPVTITRLHGGEWGYRAHAKVPRSLQIVAGVPIVLRKFHGQAGRGDWIATTSCPSDHKWHYHVLIGFTTGQQLPYDNYVPCRR